MNHLKKQFKGPFEGHLVLSERKGFDQRLDLVGQNEREVCKDVGWPKIPHIAILKLPAQSFMPKEASIGLEIVFVWAS